MENWRLEKDRIGFSSPNSTTALDPLIGLIPPTKDASDYWDDDVTRHRRYKDWKQQKSMPSLDSFEKIEKQGGGGGRGGSSELLEQALSFNDVGNQVTYSVLPTEDNVARVSGAVLTADEKETSLENRECFAEDVIKVWNQISQYIIHKLKDGYGVQIPGLGTFTVNETTPLAPGPNRFFHHRTPLFLLSNQVKKLYKLINLDEYVQGNRMQSVPLNLTEIAHKLQSPRRIIDGVVTEVLQSFARAVVCGKKVEFPFANIGKFQVQNRIAKMKFYDEFCTKMGYCIPKPNLNPPKELFGFETQSMADIAMAALTELREAHAADIEESSLPGHMTPLRKHIPTETYRSVFHLREVRSVHDGQLLVPMKMKKRIEKIEKEKKMMVDPKLTESQIGHIMAFGVRNGPLPSKETSDGEKELDMDELYRTIDHDTTLRYELMGIPQPEQPTETEILNEMIRKHRPVALHDFNNNPIIPEEEEDGGKGAAEPTAAQPHNKHGHKTEHRKSVLLGQYEAKPLYLRPSITGKYDLDITSANKPLFKDTLQGHHHAIVSQLLGVEKVKEHYARRSRLKILPLSYDDKRFNPPSPQ